MLNHYMLRYPLKCACVVPAGAYLRGNSQQPEMIEACFNFLDTSGVTLVCKDLIKKCSFIKTGDFLIQVVCYAGLTVK